ncbi:hypothetical protein SPRG_01519 [Saprolegnia parasitica CBS 223.65]|uniref:Macro domain-containing protein n=1 Tax=Saprolegnia parasitica (strain CBS 223.65) TaxID=695850 RepID=A0A067CV43_SAPPC|nr:hypothetical protein SPRG_01519 [Saprolegnia parasitica CBS 223.65]KDO34383.1 hypothetical protein SPRG_01519 [Saprolegnia parasitica CBS 223.65]|eukprot:XP_012195119.1 hypothetical protein SPRG_01519 [Saprolegnia parasitica CBS 223.65]
MELFLNPDIAASVLQMCMAETAAPLALVVLTNKQLRSYGASDALWARLVATHFGPARPYAPLVAFPVLPALCRHPTWEMELEVPPVSASCKEFIETTMERSLFQTMTVVRDNIGTIATLDATPIDCFVFPTNPSLRNHGIGAAAAIFERAGIELDMLVSSREYARTRHYDTAEVVVTPGFHSGANHLIHCIGPYWRMPNAASRLYLTYVHAFQEAVRIDARCVVVASISTGSLGFPVPEASRIAMAAYRDVVKAYRWRAKVGFICYEESIFNAFDAARQATLHRFNDGCLEIEPRTEPFGTRNRVVHSDDEEGHDEPSDEEEDA